jgi:hypothetical protein
VPIWVSTKRSVRYADYSHCQTQIDYHTPEQFKALRATQLAYRDALNQVSQYAFLIKGRANLAARGWPNWKKAQETRG